MLSHKHGILSGEEGVRPPRLLRNMNVAAHHLATSTHACTKRPEHWSESDASHDLTSSFLGLSAQHKTFGWHSTAADRLVVGRSAVVDVPRRATVGMNKHVIL